MVAIAWIFLSTLLVCVEAFPKIEGDPVMNSKLHKADYEYVDDWRSQNSMYYQTGLGDDQKLVIQPKQDGLIPVQNLCTDLRLFSAGDDFLTQTTNVVIRIAKILFGVFVILTMPLLLAKMFLLPLKLALVLKLLLNVALFWPFLSKVVGSIPFTTSVLGKLADDSDGEIRSMLDVNGTRTFRSLEETESSLFDDQFCLDRMTCFISRAIVSRNYSVKFALSLVMFIDSDGNKLKNLMKMLKKRKEFAKCYEIECSGNKLR